MKRGVKARIAGMLRWRGARLEVQTYSYSEDSTPVDPTDTFGGTPQFTVVLKSLPGDKSWRNKLIEIEDGARGRASGISRLPAGNGLLTTLQVGGRTALLNVDKQALPYTGTLDGAFRYYLSLGNLTTQITIDEVVGAKQVTLQGWKGNVLDYIRMLLVLNQLEISEVADEIVIRRIRERVAVRISDNDYPQWTIDGSSIAKKIEGYWYNNVQRTNAPVYPKGGYSDDLTIYQVDAGETVTFDIPVDVSLTSINQPTPQNFVDRNTVSPSVYSIVNTSGKVVPVDQWKAGGGSLTFEILEDLKTIRGTLIGATNNEFPPFRVAMPAGPSDVYSSLRLTGTGIFFDKQDTQIWTGANEELATQDVGATIDTPFINTLAELYDAAAWAVARWCGPIQKLTLSTSGIQRRGEQNLYRYPTIREFNAANDGKSIATFNAEWAGRSIRDFNTVMNASVQDDFENQAFGNMGGARFLDDGQWYRVRSSQLTDEFALTLERDTTVRDFNLRYAGWTIADFNEFWEGQLLSDFNVRPLVESPGVVIPSTSYGFGFGPFGLTPFGG